MLSALVLVTITDTNSYFPSQQQRAVVAFYCHHQHAASAGADLVVSQTPKMKMLECI